MSGTAADAPFQSSVRTVLPEWIDYNGHLNMAYYNVLFDTAIDEFFAVAGLGPDYLKQQNASFFTVEAHVCYVQELPVNAPVIVNCRVLDVDEKRIHAYQELVHADEGWLSATSEQLFLHVNMETRRTAPWPAEVRAKLNGLLMAQQSLPIPERSGRRIGIVRKMADERNA